MPRSWNLRAEGMRKRWPIRKGAASLSLFASLAILLGPLSSGARDADAGPEANRQAQIFAATCAKCHVGPVLGAPRVGTPEDWNARESLDFAILLEHTIDGYRDMPPLGTCSFCTERDFRGLIALMVAGSNVVVPDRVLE